MIDKSESVNWANFWWTLGADHLTFEGLWVISEKKYPADWFREEKACKDVTGKNSILQWKNIAHYTVMCQGKNFYLNRFEQKILTQTIYPHTLPHKSRMVNHIASGGRGGFDALVNVIH